MFGLCVSPPTLMDQWQLSLHIVFKKKKKKIGIIGEEKKSVIGLAQLSILGEYFPFTG